MYLLRKNVFFQKLHSHTTALQLQNNENVHKIKLTSKDRHSKLWSYVLLQSKKPFENIICTK